MKQEDSIVTTKYGDGVFIDEYQGQYSIVATREGRDGNHYIRWAFLSKWDADRKTHVPDRKKWPMKVVLGDKVRAIQTLRALLAELEADDDLPF